MRSVSPRHCVLDAVGGDAHVELAVVDVAAEEGAQERAGVDELIAPHVAHDGNGADELAIFVAQRQHARADAPAGRVEEPVVAHDGAGVDRARRSRPASRRASWPSAMTRDVARQVDARRRRGRSSCPDRWRCRSAASPGAPRRRGPRRGCPWPPRRRCRRRPCRWRCRARGRRAAPRRRARRCRPPARWRGSGGARRRASSSARRLGDARGVLAALRGRVADEEMAHAADTGMGELARGFRRRQRAVDERWPQVALTAPCPTGRAAAPSTKATSRGTLVAATRAARELGELAGADAAAGAHDDDGDDLLAEVVVGAARRPPRRRRRDARPAPPRPPTGRRCCRRG